MSVVEHEPQIQAEPKVVELDEVGKVLLRGAERVREGWFQCNPYRSVGTGQNCVLTALYGSENYSDASFEATKRLAASLGLPSGSHIPCWNNAPERTHDEVIEAIERAAYGL